MTPINQIESAMHNILWHLEKEKVVTKKLNLFHALKFLERAIELIKKEKESEGKAFKD